MTFSIFQSKVKLDKICQAFKNQREFLFKQNKMKIVMKTPSWRRLIHLNLQIKSLKPWNSLKNHKIRSIDLKDLKYQILSKNKKNIIKILLQSNSVKTLFIKATKAKNPMETLLLEKLKNHKTHLIPNMIRGKMMITLSQQKFCRDLAKLIKNRMRKSKKNQKVVILSLQKITCLKKATKRVQ